MGREVLLRLGDTGWVGCVGINAPTTECNLRAIAIFNGCDCTNCYHVGHYGRWVNESAASGGGRTGNVAAREGDENGESILETSTRVLHSGQLADIVAYSGTADLWT